MGYKILELEDYLKLPYIDELPQEVKEEIRRVRSSYEYMTPEQFDFLFKQGVVARTQKLRKPRSLWVCDEGRIWYFNIYNKTYNYIGYFK